MSHLVAVKEYTDAASMLADYAARRARMSRPGPDPVPPTPQVQDQVKPKILVFPINRPVSVDEIMRRYHYAHPHCRLAVSFTPPTDRVPSIMQIAHVVARRHRIDIEDILSDRRTKEVVAARHEAIWIAARDTKHTLTVLGRAMGRDHTSIIHAIRCENSRRGENLRNLGGVSPRKRVSAQ